VFEGLGDELFQVLFELAESGRPGKGFVVAKKRKDDVRLRSFEPVIRRSKVVAAHPGIQFVAGKTKVSKAQVPVWKLGLDQRFKPPVMLHAVCQSVANEGNVISILKNQGICCDAGNARQRQQKVTCKKLSHAANVTALPPSVELKAVWEGP